jgi:hypothetical protein
MTSINCPSLNNNTNKATFDSAYASNIVKIRYLYPNPDYSLFSNPSKCFYGYGHPDLIAPFVNYSFNFEEYFNVVKDDNQGIVNIIKYIKDKSRNDLRFVATDVKNSSLKFYYLKTEETIFRPIIDLCTNPIFNFMKSKAEITDYVLNYNNNGVKLGDQIEVILDKLVRSLNSDLKSSDEFSGWYRPKLYKKGGLAIKNLWGDFSPNSDSPYIDATTLNSLTSKNSDYDVTVIFEQQFENQKNYTTVIKEIFKFITEKIRDEVKYKNYFDEISDLFGVFNNISIRNIPNIYNTLPPTGQVGRKSYSNKDNIYIKLIDEDVKISGESCINSLFGYSFSQQWQDKWNTKWHDNKKRPIEFKLNLTKIRYPSYSRYEYESCDPVDLKNAPLCFTLFRCLGKCKIIERISNQENTINETNFEILDISVDCDFEKINMESQLENKETAEMDYEYQHDTDEKMGVVDEENINLGFSSLLYDLYNIIIGSSEEMQKAEKRCNRFNTMMVIYDKILEKRTRFLNVSFFDNNNKKVDFIKNYSKFCKNMRDTTKFNETFINTMKFRDFSYVFKNISTTPVNLNLRRMISHTIKTLQNLENVTEKIKIHFNTPTNPVFLQGGVKLLVLLDKFIQKYPNNPIFTRIKAIVTPIDFDYFTFYIIDEYPTSVIEKFSNYEDYHKPVLPSNDEWIDPNQETKEIIKVRYSIESQFSLDANTPYNIYNHIEAGYYNPDATKISRPYVVCSKKTFNVCKNNPNKINELNLVELNIVNIKWLYKILTDNKVGQVETEFLYLQSVYGYVYYLHNTVISRPYIEDFAFLLSSYMNYVYILKPNNSLIRFLVASWYLIENGFSIEKLSDMFEEFKRYLIYMGHNPVKIKLSSNNSTVEHTFDDNATIGIIRSQTTTVPFNPFKLNFKDTDKIKNTLETVVSQYTDKTLAEDAYVLDKRCEAN